MVRCCGVFRSRLREEEYRRKFLHTLCLFFTFVTVGIGVAQTGPALLDLQLITNTNTQQASVFLTGISIGSAVGCLLMALVFSRFNRTLVMAAALLTLAITCSALPWCTSYILMIAMHGLFGALTAILSAGANADLIRTWEAERRVFLQTLHFCFAAGSTIGPMITEPFLSSKPTPINTTVSQEVKYTASSAVGVNVTVVNDEVIEEKAETSATKVHFAYLITGILCFVAFLGFLVQRCFFTHKEKPQETPVPQSDLPSVKPLPIPVYVTTLAFILLFLFFLIGVESSVSAFLVTFVVNRLDWTKDAGAQLTSVFWGCYAAWRFATIFFTDFIPPFVLLMISSSTLLISTIGIILSTVFAANTGVWVCIGISGLALSSQYPSMMMWAEESILRLTARVVSLIVMACMLPGVVIPLLIGYQMQHSDPLWLFYIVTMMCGMCLILLVTLYIWTRCVVQPKTRVEIVDDE